MDNSEFDNGGDGDGGAGGGGGGGPAAAAAGDGGGGGSDGNVRWRLQRGSIRRWQSTTARRWQEGDVIRLWRWRVVTAIDGGI
jgi:hypothetical protein